LRNFLRFTCLIILLAACGCGGSRADAERRYQNGFETTMQILGEWLVPFRGRATASAEVPLWTSAASMVPETAGSRAAAREYFAHAVDTRALPSAFTAALEEYGSRRGVSKIVDREYFAVYRGRAEARFFGGRVPRDLHLQIPVEAGADRALQTVFTLERWVGRPVFDAIVLEFVTASAGRQPSLDDFADVASRVSGQDLHWLFDEALKKTGRFDYAVETFDSEPDGDGRFRTSVTVRRIGDAVVARSIPVTTTFADGDSVTEKFDGRSEQTTYKYRSESRAATAQVDPDRLLLLDENWKNNGMSIGTANATTAANRWSARWMVWLEDALLAGVALS